DLTANPQYTDMNTLKTNTRAWLLASTVLFTVGLSGQDSTLTGEDEIAELDVITVTGELRDRTLLETVNSVKVTDSVTMQERNLQTLEDVVQRTPGVMQFGQDGGYAIRGVSVFGSGGAGTLFGTTLAVTVDGVRQSAATLQNNPFNLFDTEQVEIFLGGQSTNRGASAIAGGIEIKTRDPIFFNEAQIEGRSKFSNVNSAFGYTGNVMGNYAINDNWAVRAVASYEEFDGYEWNPFLLEDSNPQDQLEGRVKLKFQTDDESFSSLTTVAYSDYGQGSEYVLHNFGTDGTYNPTVPGDPYFGVTYNDIFERERPVDAYTFESVEDVSVAQLFQKDFENGFKAEILGSYLESTQTTAGDFDGTTADEGRSVSEAIREIYTVEAKLLWETDKQNLTLGLFATNEEVENTSAAITSIEPLLFIVTIFPEFAPLLPLLPEELEIGFTTLAEKENYAFFGEYEYFFTEKLSARVGMRLDYEEQTTSADNTVNIPFELPFFQTGLVEGTEDFSTFLPSASITYRFNELSNISALYKQDYRSGGITTSLEVGVIGYDPEYAESIEIAYRAQNIADTNISAQFNLYLTEWEDQQVSVIPEGGTFAIIQNAGKSTQWGGELLIDWKASDTVDVYLSSAYIDTNFDEFDGELSGDFSENEFPYSPSWAFAGGLTWKVTENLKWDINFSYQQDSFTGAANDDNVNEIIEANPGAIIEDYAYQNDAFFIMNTSFTYNKGDWSLGVYANNMFDAEYVSWGGNTVSVAPPLTFGVSFGKFF
ncbi:MAG: TonB-dependent receptor, partial [Verrucomicrobiota bacterium]